jgi:hypothetical protein
MQIPARWQKSSAVFGFAAFFGLGYFLFIWVFAGNPPSQPIRYNHSVHIANGLTCVDCHTGAQDQVHATLPTLDTCMMCHSEAGTDNPEEEKIRQLAAAGQMSPWRKINRLPPHVYFSHRRHVALGKLECSECHGPVETLTEPRQRPFRPRTMEACLDCHEQRKVDSDCNRCHR